MKHVVGKTLLISFAAFVLMTLVSPVSAQWGDPVSVYDARNGRGNESSFGVGEFRNNRGEFGTLRNDSAYSVSVPRGFRVRFCENEGGNGQGGGNCEEYGEGNHNLRYAGQASYLRVWGPSGGWNGGWNGGGQQGVTVYEDRFSGRSQTYGVGRYLNAGGQLGNIRNDRASSVVVQRGFRVRLCSDEGSSGRGEGRCEEYNEGRHTLRDDDSASFIEVRRTGGGGWGGGGWNDPPGGGGGWGNDGGNWGGSNLVVVFADPNQRGRRQEFGVGTYRSDRGGLGQLGNDEASSVFVPRGYRVRICENEGGFLNNGGGRCEEFGPGSHNLRYNDRASFIRVTRN
jgi:hypothetical protein